MLRGRNLGFIAAVLVVLAVSGIGSADVSSFTLDGTGVIQGTDVLVSGTITCDAGDFYWIRVRLRQPGYDGGDSSNVSKDECTGSEQVWQQSVPAKTGSPSPGSAKAVARFGTLSPDLELIEKGSLSQNITLVLGNHV